MLAFALLFIGAQVAVHLEEVEGVSAEDAQSIAESFAEAIETRTASTAAVDETLWACDAEDRCADAIRSRTGATDLVFLRIFGGPASVRLSAEVLRASPGKAGLNIERGLAVTPVILAPLAAALFAAGAPKIVDQKNDLVPPIEPHPRSITPWILLGGGGIAAGVGTAFVLSARDAQNEIETRDHPNAQTEELASRQRTHGIAAASLLVTGACAAATAVVWWILE